MLVGSNLDMSHFQVARTLQVNKRMGCVRWVVLVESNLDMLHFQVARALQVNLLTGGLGRDGLCSMGCARWVELGYARDAQWMNVSH